MDMSLRTSDAFAGKISSFTITVVDDGSSDGTSDEAKKRGAEILLQKPNQGKGAAVRRGILDTEAEYYLFSDADLSTPIHESISLFEPLAKGKADVSIGSRGIDYGKIKKHQPFYREFMGKTFNKIVSLIALKGIRDTQCGFKMFTSESAKKIFSNTKIDGFGFDVEVLYLARLMGYEIAEIPVEWHNDDRTKVNPITDPIKMLLDISRIKKIHQNLGGK